MLSRYQFESIFKNAVFTPKFFEAFFEYFPKDEKEFYINLLNDKLIISDSDKYLLLNVKLKIKEFISRNLLDPQPIVIKSVINTSSILLNQYLTDRINELNESSPFIKAMEEFNKENIILYKKLKFRFIRLKEKLDSDKIPLIILNNSKYTDQNILNLSSLIEISKTVKISSIDLEKLKLKNKILLSFIQNSMFK